MCSDSVIGVCHPGRAAVVCGCCHGDSVHYDHDMDAHLGAVSAFSPADHYAHLAAGYDDVWEHSSRFRGWVCDQIEGFAPLPPDAVIADIGGGTGIYSEGLLDRMPGAMAYVVDPSQEMLDQVNRQPRLVTVCSDADGAAEALRDLSVSGVDLVFIKEAVHHFPDPAGALSSLARIVRPGGYFVIMMLPKTIGYPLFAAALRRFTELQPDPGQVQAALTDTGLTVTRFTRGHELTFETDRWIGMVERRFMSMLSTFSDAEIAAGVEEIREHIKAPSVTFFDNFELIVGVNRQSQSSASRSGSLASG